MTVSYTHLLIHRLKELGVFFVAASGRQFPIMQRMFAPVKEEIGYVCENGALTYTDGEFLYLSLIHI